MGIWIKRKNKIEEDEIMKKKQRQTLCYTIEREYLNQISISQLLTQIVRSHIKNDMVEKRMA